jgi:hypothetical protein
MRKSLAAAALITGSLLTGGAIGSAFLGAGPATAQSSGSDSSSSSDGSSGSSSDAPATPGQPPADHPGPGRRGPHAHPDLGVAASTIGVTVDELRSALESGQSVADVANAHGVDPQKVIDALVADAQSKIDERVASGDLTQEQADEIKADLPDRIADFVNRAGLPGPGGRGGHGDCPDMDGAAPGAGSGSGSDSSSSSDSSASSSGTSFAA